MSNDLLTYAAKVEKLRADMRVVFSSSAPVWEIEQLSAFIAHAIGKLSPLQIGDVAELVKTPDINERDSWGWMGHRHILVEGRRGVVRTVSWRDGVFFFQWEPVDQTWKDQAGNEHPVSSPGLFRFSERWLRKCP